MAALSGISSAGTEQVMRAHVELIFRTRRPAMPAWLEILLNLSGYAGFVALATSGVACPRDSADDEVYGGKR